MNQKTLVLLLAGLATTAQAFAQVDLRTYVALGDSLSAGVVSGSLVETHQLNSFPALIARQAGISDFQQPLVSEPGLPPELVLQALTPSSLIVPKSPIPGVPVNAMLARPYNNLAVPAATSLDALDTRSGGAHDLVLRGLGTALEQALSLKPSLVTLWIGSNDVLGAVVNGQAVDGVTLVPAAAFRAAFAQIVAALKSSGATVIVANIADVTSIPFATTIPSVVVNPATREPVLLNGQPVPLIGPTGPLASGSLVTLRASPLLAEGIGIPAALGGRGTPLPDDVILDPAEVAAIRDRVRTDNQAISDIAQAAGAPVLDVNALFSELITRGRDIGGVTLSGAFLSGGIFSYDGLHPTELGYALLANEWIELINRQGAQLPAVDLAPFLGIGGTTAATARGAAPVTGHSSREPLGLGAARSPGRAGLEVAFEFTKEAGDWLLALFPRLDLR